MSTSFDLWGQRGWASAEVVGESHYRAAIRALFGPRLPADGSEITVSARLLPEPSNRHDRNAVAVHVGSAQVGYLPREAAIRYAPVLAGLVARGWTPQVGARVWGSEWNRGEFSGSVRLDLAEPHMIIPANQPPPETHRLLPAGGAIQVTGEDRHLDALAPWLRPEGECWVHVTLHEITEQLARSARTVVEVRIDGIRIGQLSPRMSGEVLAAVRHLAERGLVACARAIVKGNRIKTEVIVYAARAHELPESWLSDPPEAAPALPRSAAAPAVQPPPVVTPPVVQPAPAPTPPVVLAPAPVGQPASAGPSAAETAVFHAPVGLKTVPIIPPGPPSPPGPSGPADPSSPPGPVGLRFNPPPTWPAPPPGWSPQPGWAPDPGWGPPPAGWQLWIEEPRPDAGARAPGMIARTWRGWAPAATADEYQRHYESEVAESLARIPGFRGARLLRRDDGDEVAFTAITFFDGMDDVRAFAGEDPSVAVVEEAARRVLSRWESWVSHDEVAVVVVPR
ncbi:HIRAN domain-containing protein [Actinoplanes sp. HUAS TT8]|uniref:HIRAN domain-containing protein n=1 Tax=Actinoplanes sp. HUAS TT8 TaxID=3447453 RepID=UPI003F523465